MHLLNAELACKIHNWRRVSRPIIGDCVDLEPVLRGGRHIKGGLKCGDTCAKTDIKAAERGLHCLSVLHREREELPHSLSQFRAFSAIVKEVVRKRNEIRRRLRLQQRLALIQSAKQTQFPTNPPHDTTSPDWKIQHVWIIAKLEMKWPV